MKDGTPGGIRLDRLAYSYPEMRLCFDETVPGGEVTAVMGPSGSGKSTLLDLVAGFRQPESGRVVIAGQDVTRLPPDRRPVSMIFQENNLFAHLDVGRNVGLGISPSLRLTAANHRAVAAALERTGLAGKEKRLPRELSGGERQRVALARALVTTPRCVLADEPTGNLDRRNANAVFDLMLDLNRVVGTALVIVTHDPDLAAKTDRILHLVDGRLQ